MAIPAANAVGGDDNKRYVIHQEMVMVQKITPSNPRTLFKGVIAIPKGRLNGKLITRCIWGDVTNKWSDYN